MVRKTMQIEGAVVAALIGNRLAENNNRNASSAGSEIRQRFG
jgi:hypothetical protein